MTTATRRGFLRGALVAAVAVTVMPVALTGCGGIVLPSGRVVRPGEVLAEFVTDRQMTLRQVLRWKFSGEDLTALQGMVMVTDQDGSMYPFVVPRDAPHTEQVDLTAPDPRNVTVPAGAALVFRVPYASRVASGADYTGWTVAQLRSMHPGVTVVRGGRVYLADAGVVQEGDVVFHSPDAPMLRAAA